MASSSNYYHLMLRAGTTTGKTGGDDPQRYRYQRYEIVEAPKTEFEHLGDDVRSFSSEEKAQKAGAEALGK